MSNNKQQTAVDVAELAMKLYPFSNSERNAFITGYNKAKEMEKERIETAYNKGTVHGIDYPESTLPITGEQYYNETYGDNK
jgi:hypothetical protein